MAPLTRDDANLAEILDPFDEGQIELGLELHTFVMQQPYFGNSVYRQDIIGQHVEARIADLSVEERRTAEERGKNRDLWETVDEVLDSLQP